MADPDNAPLPSAQAQILVQALQNFIMPLVIAPKSRNRDDTNQTLWGLEAEIFLTALHDFISSIMLYSQSESNSRNDNRIEVTLHDNEAENKEEIVVAAVEKMSPLQRTLTALRERVFNKMPIRMLHIIPHDASKLQISLIERGAVYALLAAQLEAEFSEESFVSAVDRNLLIQDPAVGENSVIEEWVSRYASYAILSHTWIRTAGGEVTYSSWKKGTFDFQDPGYQKLVNFCRVAWMDYGATYAWMDTVCIDKESSSELDESIRSMYKWYQNSTVCITYLAGTRELGNMHEDPWFTRGWTFQELLAPDYTKFYNKDWKKIIPSFAIADKSNRRILYQIRQATTITAAELRNPEDIPISRKLQLAAQREVMREEDSTYSLMGICDVSISIAYGEGAERAFFRLMAEILNSFPYVFEVFNCAQYSCTSIIPSTPSAYLQRSGNFRWLAIQKPIEPLMLTHLGLRIPILLMASFLDADLHFKNNPIGDYYAIATLANLKYRGLVKNLSGPFHLLDQGIKTDSECIIFGVLNFGGDKTRIEVPRICLALSFWSYWNAEWESASTSIKRHETHQPTVFKLKKRKSLGAQGIDAHPHSYLIERGMLEKHGMKIVTMYL